MSVHQAESIHSQTGVRSVKLSRHVGERGGGGGGVSDTRKRRKPFTFSSKVYLEEAHMEAGWGAPCLLLRGKEGAPGGWGWGTKFNSRGFT